MNSPSAKVHHGLYLVLVYHSTIFISFKHSIFNLVTFFNAIDIWTIIMAFFDNSIQEEFFVHYFSLHIQHQSKNLYPQKYLSFTNKSTKSSYAIIQTEITAISTMNNKKSCTYVKITIFQGAFLYYYYYYLF